MQSLARWAQIAFSVMAVGCMLGAAEIAAAAGSSQQTVSEMTESQKIEWILQALQLETTPENLGERASAVWELTRSGLARDNATLQAALIEATDRANEEYLQSFRDSDPTYGEGQGENFLELIKLVIRYAGADGIPVLMRTLHTGGNAQQALADFGEPVAAPILEAWHSRPVERRARATLARRWSGLLGALALLVDRGDLGGETLRDINSVAREALEDPDNVDVLIAAIPLTLALGNPALVAQVEAMADDPEEIRRRGIEDQWSVGFIGKVARRRLEELDR